VAEPRATRSNKKAASGTLRVVPKRYWRRWFTGGSFPAGELIEATGATIPASFPQEVLRPRRSGSA
jgi:hypothetical protein